MNAVWTLANKDLLLLWRDKLSLFWMLGFPLVFATFFGSIFGGSGPGKSNPMHVAVIGEDLTDAGRRFVERLDASDAVDVEELPRAKAVEAVRKGQMVAYLDVRRMPNDGFEMFANGGQPEIEIGIDPSRQAEKGALQGLVMAAAFAGFKDLFSDPTRGRAEAKKMIERVQQDAGVPPAQKAVLTTFFGALDRFLDDADFGAGQGTAAPRSSRRSRRSPSLLKGTARRTPTRSRSRNRSCGP